MNSNQTPTTPESYYKFVFNEEANIDLINLLLPTKCEVEWVEHKRQHMIKGHLDRLLTDTLSVRERNLEVAYLGHLGGTALLEYLPDK